MNRFDAFIRFFPVNDNGMVWPKNTQLPTERYATLPAVPGDRLRVLVPPADCWQANVDQLTLNLRPAGSSAAGSVTGVLRRQAGELYTEIVLRVESPPTAGIYSQFALMVGSKNVMGTFRGQQTDIDQYVQAIVEHYANFPFALVDVDRMGQLIRIRVYPNNRFRLNSEAMRVGIGTVRERNTNSPSLLAQKQSSLSLDAEDRYVLSVSADIQKGNLFGLEEVTYTASGTEKPVDILRALGVPTGSFVREGGSAVVAFANVGTQTITNSNRPNLQLLFDHTSAGNDYYLAVVGADLQPGNIFQVAAAGSTTKTVTAVPNSTKASIEALFNTVSGFFILPAGSLPIVSALPGSQTINNTNNPSVQLTLEQSLPDRVVDLYTIYVGQSVVEGNLYQIDMDGITLTAEAAADDDALWIATKLGYDRNPFTIDVEQGVSVRTVARKGPLYHESTNLSAVTLLSARTFHGLPHVAEIQLRHSLSPGEYQLVLARGENIVSVSNLLRVQSSAQQTALIRFGADQVGSVFGIPYAEDGLQQQVRLPIYVDSPRLSQTENLFQDLDFQTVRGRTSARLVSSLTTRNQPASFHRNLWMALKHPVLYVDDVAYTCEGEYTETPNQGRSRERQGQAQLTQLEAFDQRPTFDPLIDSLSGTYCVISKKRRLDGLWIAAKRLSFVQELVEGVTLPAADYDLLIRCGAEPLRLTISHEGLRIATFLLTPFRLNHLRGVRFQPGRIELTAEGEETVAISYEPDRYEPQDVEVSSVLPETAIRPGDFGGDFNPSFSKS